MPRKPQQRRSKETVQDIVEAGFIAVAKYGRDGATTRRIADIAGISVGSLYEYFANKDDVFTAMLERYVEEVVGMLEPRVPHLVRMSLRELVIDLLYQFKELMLRNDGLYLECARYAVEGIYEKQFEKVEKLLMELLTHYFMHNPETVRVRDFRATAYIMISGGVLTLNRYLVSPPANLTFEQLAEGLANMVTGYVAEERRQLET